MAADIATIVFSLCKALYDQVDTVLENVHQSRELAHRVRRLENVLRECQDVWWRERLELAITLKEILLEGCEFLTRFSGRKLVARYLFGTRHERMFQTLNMRLDRIAIDLGMLHQIKTEDSIRKFLEAAKVDEEQVEDSLKTKSSMRVRGQQEQAEQQFATQAMAHRLQDVEHWYISLDHIEIERRERGLGVVRLGEGSSGTVMKAWYCDHPVAVKVLTRGCIDAEVYREFKSEVDILTNISHPNVLKAYGAYYPRDKSEAEELEPALVLEYMEGGDLRSLLSRRAYSDLVIVGIMLGVAKGMCYLHNVARLAHRDLKPENILLDDQLCAKIADFGHSQRKSNSRSAMHGVRHTTVLYNAPEVLKHTNHYFSSDVWSFGVILWEVSMRKPLFDTREVPTEVVMDMIKNNEIPAFEPGEPNSAQAERVLRLVPQCLRFDESARPRFAAVLMELESIYKAMLNKPTESLFARKPQRQGHAAKKPHRQGHAARNLSGSDKPLRNGSTPQVSTNYALGVATASPTPPIRAGSADAALMGLREQNATAKSIAMSEMTDERSTSARSTPLPLGLQEQHATAKSIAMSEMTDERSTSTRSTPLPSSSRSGSSQKRRARAVSGDASFFDGNQSPLADAAVQRSSEMTGLVAEIVADRTLPPMNGTSRKSQMTSGRTSSGSTAQSKVRAASGDASFFDGNSALSQVSSNNSVDHRRLSGLSTASSQDTDFQDFGPRVGRSGMFLRKGTLVGSQLVKASIMSIHASPRDGKVAGGSSTGTIYIHSSGGKEWKTLADDKTSVSSVHFSPTSAQLVSASSDGMLRLWDVDKGVLLSRKSSTSKSKSFRKRDPACFWAQWNLSATAILAGYEDGTVNFLDGHTGVPTNRPKLHNDDVLCASLMSDHTVLTGGADGKLTLFDMRVKKEVQTRKFPSRVSSVCSTGDLDTAIVGLADGQLLCLAVTSQMKTKTTMNGHTKRVQDLACSGRILASVSWDGTVRLWTKEGVPVASKRIGDKLNAISACPRADTSNEAHVGRFAFGGENKKLSIWDMELDG